MPDSANHTQQEIELQLALGVPLLSIKGVFRTAEVHRVYDRARHLCREVEARPELIMALFWLSSLHYAWRIRDWVSSGGKDAGDRAKV